MPPLTAPERVLVNDGWNKFLANQDWLSGLFFARLLHEEPDLAELTRGVIDEMPDRFAQLFDLGVRQLTPPTVAPHQRGYCPHQPNRLRESIGWLNKLGMQRRHWFAARRVWCWTLARVPHFEPYDQQNLALGSESAMYRFFTLSILTPVLEQPEPESQPTVVQTAQQRLRDSARAFIDQLAQELDWSVADHEQRRAEVDQEISATGTYVHTTDELTYGAMLAWRNAPRCIGRNSWRTMIVRDRRHVTEPDAIFAECAEHLRVANNGGAIRSIMTVFRPKQPGEQWGPRIWNEQYIRFAGYEQPDGTVLGDRANLDLTRAIRQLGWTPPAQPTAFDCLPLVIDVPGQQPRFYSFEAADLLRVSLTHPDYPAFDNLQLHWCAVPAISNFLLDIGGVQYGCAPFNGWFMETEIARDLWEADRYNKAEAIAHSLGLDTTRLSTLWRDRAFLELNVAILHSFAKAKVMLIDHQTASRQFMVHDLREKRAGRECPAQWSWVVPSAGGSTTPVWHHEMRDFDLNPSLKRAPDRWVVL